VVSLERVAIIDDHDFAISRWFYPLQLTLQIICVFERREVWIRQVYRGRAYVDMSLRKPPWASLRVVELDAGRATRREPGTPLPWLLLETASGRWDD